MTSLWRGQTPPYLRHEAKEPWAQRHGFEEGSDELFAHHHPARSADRPVHGDRLFDSRETGMVVAFVMAAAMNLFAYWNSDKMVLSMYGARAVDERSAPELYALVRQLAAAAGLPLPRVYVMDNPQPNAFATGRNPQNAAVAVTTGLLSTVNQEELAGVLVAVILVVPMCLLCSSSASRWPDMDINIFVQIGFIVLVGLASKNAILIVEFAKEQSAQGVTPREATLEACRLRLRPIIMTSLAFILGVVPLAIAVGAGAEMRRTLGIAVFSGMLGVTLFGIFLTPVFYYVVVRMFGLKPAGTAPMETTAHGQAIDANGDAVLATASAK